MSFVMTPAEQQAATQAMNGTAPVSIVHLILLCGTTAAVVWASLVFVGTLKNFMQNRASLDDVLGECAMAISLLIIACIYTTYF